MKLNNKGQYAVTALLQLAQIPGSRSLSLGDLAQRLGVSLSYLETLFANLRTADLVKSVRGPGGGYRLARSAESITIGDVFAAVDGHVVAFRRRDAAPKDWRTIALFALTDDLWRSIDEELSARLDDVSLADLLNKGTLLPRNQQQQAVAVDHATGVAAAGPEASDERDCEPENRRRSRP